MLGVSSLPEVCPLGTDPNIFVDVRLSFMDGNMVLVEITFHFKMTKKLMIMGYGLIKGRFCSAVTLTTWYQGKGSFLPFPYKADSLHLAMYPALFSEAHAFLTQ